MGYVMSMDAYRYVKKNQMFLGALSPYRVATSMDRRNELKFILKKF